MKGRVQGSQTRRLNRSGSASRAQDRWFFAQIAEQVVDRRHELGLSQAQLAAVSGTTQSAIARLESGGRPPRIDTLLRLAQALDCELVAELRGREAPSPTAS
jgi:transcriptional regulator with XRE-family HTH domain